MNIRPAFSSERPAVFNVLDGALLAIEYDRVSELLETEQVHVAVTETEPERILGVVVIENEEILAIAVRRRRRGQGIGTALVTDLKQRNDRLVACFDERVAPFWQAMQFITDSSTDTGRLRGVWESA